MARSDVVCIANPSFEGYSETFLRDHVAHLPFDVRVLHGGKLERTGELDFSHRSRIQRLWDRLSGAEPEDDLEARRIAWLKASGVQAVLAEYGFTGMRLVSTCARARVPLIVHFHGYDAYNEDALQPHRERYAVMFRQAEAFIAVSQAMAARLAELGAPSERIHYAPCMVDPAQIAWANPQSAPPTILSVGRFVEKKGPMLTILAFAKAFGDRPEVRLEMIGEGPLLGSCRWLATSLGISDQVIFRGKQSREEVFAAMARARVFAQHSVCAANGDCEGTPVAVLEAQCAGLPVVGSAHTGIAEVVAHGETGWLCAEGDVATMAAQLREAIDLPPENMAVMSRAARRRIETHFSKPQTISRLAEVIENVIADRKEHLP